MFHIIYKTTNLINNKIYIGYHFQEKNPYEFDGYFGSGVKLNKAIKKYGSNNFCRETLYVFTCELSALKKEAEIVNESFLLRKDVYNLTLGGGNPPSQKGIPKSELHKQKIGNSQRGKIITDEAKNKISKKLLGRKKPNRSFSWRKNLSESLKGKKHSEQSKNKMRENHSDVSGSKNPMFGKLGQHNPNFGRKNSSETIEQMKISSLASQIELTCPHCHVTGKRAGMQRWHFEKCRSLK